MARVLRKHTFRESFRYM